MITCKMTCIEQVEIVRLRKGDLARFLDLIKLFEVVFEMENFSIPESRHLQKVLNRKNFFVFVAILENKVVGGLTTYVLDQYYSKKPLAYIYDLAIDIGLQRQGIGTKLISVVNDFYKKRGFEEVFIQVDMADKYAIDFYRSTKPDEEEQVLHFSYALNK